MASNEILDGMIYEIRRGSIVLCVLSLLGTPKYGYSLLTELNECGVAVDAGTLYPLLRRLEKQGLLTSQWDTEGSKPRKYYKMNEEGKKIHAELSENWLEMSKTVQKLLHKQED